MIREDFPFLMRHSEVVYLDNAATSMHPQAVIDAINEYYLDLNASVHRSTFGLAYAATQRYEQVRSTVATHLNAAAANEILFTKGATQSLNWVAFGYALQHLQPGDEILISILEHHSNLVVWQQVAQQTGAVLKYIPLSADQQLDLVAAKELITDHTKILAISGMSNVMGCATPLAELSQMIHAVDGIFVVDGAQLLPVRSVDVQALDIDFLALSGHKMLGPTGIGVLYGKAALLEELQPIEFGGEMVDVVTEQTATFQNGPMKFEAGTQNIAGVHGLGAAITYMDQVGMATIENTESELGQYLADRLRQIGGITVYGPQHRDSGIVAFNVDGVHPHDVATFLDSKKICVRAGQHCAQPLLAALGTDATVRASLAFYNTKNECDRLVGAVEEAKEFFNHG